MMMMQPSDSSSSSSSRYEGITDPSMGCGGNAKNRAFISTQDSLHNPCCCAVETITMCQTAEGLRHNPETLLQDNEMSVLNYLYGDWRHSQLRVPESSQKAEGFHEDKLDYIEKINELYSYIDIVKKTVKPGCSPDMLKIALNSTAYLVNFLDSMSSKPNLHSSL